MKILNDVNLSDYTTMRLGGLAKYLVDVHGKIDLQNTLRWAKSHNMPIVVIGSGSNVLFADDGFGGMVIINKIEGFETLSRDDMGAVLKIGGGELWDSVVQRTVEMGLSGIEAMSMIPGTAGAAPIQNIGAYGQELADTFVELEAYDLNTGDYVILSKDQCEFGYRTSIFKNANPRRYIITSITLKLSQLSMNPPFYESLQEYLTKNSITQYSPSTIRQAVVAIRADKLPDPKKLASCGSFFKSAIIDRTKFDQLRKRYPKLPGFELSETRVKVPAGWLVENVGYKGIVDENGMGTYNNHALVVVNHSAKSYQALDDFTGKIVKAVEEKFGIVLQREPELITTD